MAQDFDWRARRNGDEPLDAWEVLAEEFEAAGNSLGGSLDTLAEIYFQQKQIQAGPGFENARRAVEEELFRHFHAHPRTALCFSGGGVRSATFGLGVLHGMAKINPSPLPEFDFLSTVSGGGYLGGWFSAWASRAETPGVPNGAIAVTKALADIPTTTLDPEPAPLLHIREYCRFLNPKMGALSADTWALVATVGRNMVLNWLVLIPLLMAVLVIPRLYADFLLSNRDPDALLWSGFALGVIATAYIVSHLPTFRGSNRGTEKGFLGWVLLPLTLGAMLLSLHWAWRLHHGQPNYTWWQFIAFGAGIHFAGSLVAALLLRPKSGKALLIAAVGLTAAALSGAGAGFLAWLGSNRLERTDWDNPQLYACVAVPCILLAFSIAALLAVGLASEVTDDDDREWWSRAGGWLLIVATAWSLFSVSVLYVPQWLGSAAAKISTIIATGGIGALASRLGFSASTAAGRREEDKGGAAKRTSVPKDVIARIAGPVFLLLLVAVLAMANARVIAAVPNWWSAPRRDLLVMAGFALVALVSSYFININRFSLHAMYRARLVRTYLGASRSDRQAKVNRFTDLDEADNVPLAALSRHKPLHILNMTLNLVGGKNLAWQQRKAESFTASRLRTGSLRVGYQETKKYGRRFGTDAGLTLGSAVTISGAAASPNMGYHSSPLVSFVMTLFNARLGWWLGNPGPSGKGVWGNDGPGLSFVPIINEAFGRTNDASKWVYLSDGGHFENLGLYEMVLRRCGTIVVVDGSQDVPYTFEDLGNAVRKVRVDLGIQIEFKDGLPIYGARDPRNRYCALGRIVYDCVDGKGVEAGTILYIKACLNGSEPEDVQNYASINTVFPQQGTEQLWFDESQFESYRRLGSHIIEQLDASLKHKEASPVKQLVKAGKAYIGSPDAALHT